jgi:hypothetical protein
MVRLLLLGASGVVGRAVLQLALEHQGVAAVIAPTRNVLPSHGKLTNPVTAELESLLPQAIERWSIDAVICALGTTMKKAVLRMVQVFAPILPRRLRANPASTIARVALEAVVNPRPGVHVVFTQNLTARG